MTVTYDGVKLEHKGDHLYADGVEWSYIGSSERSTGELISIYRKYLDPSAGR